MIVLEIKRESDQSNYVATSIETGVIKAFSKPTLRESTVDATINATLKALQNIQFEMMWGKI